MSKRWMHVGIYVLAAMIVIGYALRYYCGTEHYALSRAGASFFRVNQNYTMTETACTSDSVACDIDLYDLPSNVGKVLFDDGTCSIEILEVREDGYDGYNIYFLARGDYALDGARLVTSLPHDSEQYLVGGIEVTLGDAVYQHDKCIVAGKLTSKYGDEYGFQLFPNDCYDHGVFVPAEEIEKHNGIVTVRLMNLYEINWLPKSDGLN